MGIFADLLSDQERRSKMDMVIQRLRQLQEEIPALKAEGVNYRQTAEFSRWRDGLGKWLQLGLPYTQREQGKIQSLSYCVVRIRLKTRTRGGGYDQDDEAAYQRDLDRAHNLIDSAIENVELDLVPEQPKAPAEPKRGRKREEPRSVSVGEARTVIVGDSNIISIIDTITVSDFLSSVRKEIDTKVDDEDKKRGLLQKFKEVSEHPMVTTILGQTLGDVLRRHFGV